MLRNILKRASNYFQTSNTSYERHNRELESENKLEIERKVAKEYFEKNTLNSPELRVVDLLKKYPDVLVAVDIGSGAGWGSVAVSNYVAEVKAIEPSQAGLDISKKLYPANDYPNITWIQGMAEEVLNSLVLDKPTLFMTGCVLSHLRDKEVLAICDAIVKIAPAGSVLAFSEAWNETEWQQIMWHVRSKKWWQKALPGWELDFHGPKAEDYKKCHMGFWGVKE